MKYNTIFLKNEKKTLLGVGNLKTVVGTQEYMGGDGPLVPSGLLYLFLST